MSSRTIKLMPLLALVLASLLLESCQVASPASRIKEHPALFAALPDKEQKLVQQGEIGAGMSPEAVFLAWGHPNSRPFVGEKNGKRLERWEYTRLEPVMVVPSLSIPCRDWHGWHHEVDTAFVPHHNASVLFEDGKVTEWEARR